MYDVLVFVSACMRLSVLYVFLFLMVRLPPRSTRTDARFPYTTLFRSPQLVGCVRPLHPLRGGLGGPDGARCLLTCRAASSPSCCSRCWRRQSRWAASTRGSGPHRACSPA